MTGEQLLTGEILTGEIITGSNHLFGSPDSIGNAFSFYKGLVVGILPLLKTIAFWLVVVLVVFFALLFLFNYMSSKGRKKIQKEVKDDLHRRNREIYEKMKKSAPIKDTTMDHGGDHQGHESLDPNIEKKGI